MSKKNANKRSLSTVEKENEVEEAYFVEEILNKRIKNRKLQYLLKWKGYGPEYNSWEPVERMGCPEIVKEFERNLKLKQETGVTTDDGKKTADGSAPDDPVLSKSLKLMAKRQVGMIPARDSGLKPHKILRASGSSLENMMFLIKWMDVEEMDILPAAEVNVMYPELVISFYEERMNWTRNEN